MTSLETDFLAELKAALSKLRRTDSQEASANRLQSTADEISPTPVQLVSVRSPCLRSGHQGDVPVIQTIIGDDVIRATPDANRRRVPDCRILKNPGFRARPSPKANQNRPRCSPNFSAVRKKSFSFEKRRTRPSSFRAGRDRFEKTTVLNKVVDANDGDDKTKAFDQVGQANNADINGSVVVNQTTSSTQTPFAASKGSPPDNSINATPTAEKPIDVFSAACLTVAVKPKLRALAQSEPPTPTADNVLFASGVANSRRLNSYANARDATKAAVPSKLPKNRLFGELNSVLERRMQQASAITNVAELETKLKTGKSVLYVGKGVKHEGEQNVAVVQKISTDGRSKDECKTGDQPVKSANCPQGIEINTKHDITESIDTRQSNADHNADKSSDVKASNENNTFQSFSMQEKDTEFASLGEIRANNLKLDVSSKLRAQELRFLTDRHLGALRRNISLPSKFINRHRSSFNAKFKKESTSTPLSGQSDQRLLKDVLPTSSLPFASEFDTSQKKIHSESFKFERKCEQDKTFLEPTAKTTLSSALLNLKIVGSQLSQHDNTEFESSSKPSRSNLLKSTLDPEASAISPFQRINAVQNNLGSDLRKRAILLRRSWPMPDNISSIEKRRIGSVNINLWETNSTNVSRLENKLVKGRERLKFNFDKNEGVKKSANNEASESNPTTQLKSSSRMSNLQPTVQSKSFHEIEANSCADGDTVLIPFDVADCKRIQNRWPEIGIVLQDNPENQNSEPHSEEYTSKSAAANELNEGWNSKELSTRKCLEASEHCTENRMKDGNISVKLCGSNDCKETCSLGNAANPTSSPSTLMDIKKEDGTDRVSILALPSLQCAVVDTNKDTSPHQNTMLSTLDETESQSTDSISTVTVTSLALSTSNSTSADQNVKENLPPVEPYIIASDPTLVSVLGLPSTYPIIVCNCDTDLTSVSFRDSACATSDFSASGSSDFVTRKPSVTTRVHWTDDRSGELESDRTETQQQCAVIDTVDDYNSAIDDESSQETDALLSPYKNQRKESVIEIPQSPESISGDCGRRKPLRVVSYSQCAAEGQHKLHSGDIICSGFSTYPLLRTQGKASSPLIAKNDKDVITSMLITHSGEPIPSDHSSVETVGRNASRRYDLPLSVTVTIPEPTSFHQHGNRISQHLIGSAKHLIQAGGGGNSYANPQMETAAFEEHYKQKVEKPRSLIGGSVGKRADKEGGESSSLLAVITPGLKAPGRLPLIPVQYHAGEDSDLSSSSFTNETAHNLDRNWRLSSPNTQGTFNKESAVIARCNPDDIPSHRKQIGSRKAASRTFSQTDEQTLEPIHSSDADTESLYQDTRGDENDEDDYAQSLIRYVKSQDMAGMTEDIKNLYRYQIDAALSRSQASVFGQIACCFACNHAPSRVLDRSSHFDSTHGDKSNLPRIGLSDYFAPVTVYGSGLTRGVVNQTAFFFIDTKASRGSLTVRAQGPSAAVECFSESGADSTTHRISFTPVEVGVHSITVTWNEHQLPGSPFQSKITDPSNVSVVGGWNRLLDARGRIPLKVNVRKRIAFNTKRAGPGQLSAQLTGPDGHDVKVVVALSSKHKYTIKFVPCVEGEYQLRVLWSDLPITCSPILGLASRHGGGSNPPDPSLAPRDPEGGGGDSLLPSDYSLSSSSRCTPWPSTPSPERVVLQGVSGLTDVRVAQAVQLVIDGSEAEPGDPAVRLIGVRSEVEVPCDPLGANKYICVCSPNAPGAYLLCVTWSGYHISGSPYRLTVAQFSDASKVVCCGEGLRRGKLGQDLEISINTEKAGPGDLSASCSGPTQPVACRLLERVRSRFTLIVRPCEVGTHLLRIKFDDVHVTGSPFSVRVTGPPDEKRVTVSGPGVRDGILAQYCSVFIVETTGAGCGQLTVKVRGPKGSFRVEMERDGAQERTIRCRYSPTECGLYTVDVQWSGTHVPGSPFHVHIVDSQGELDELNGMKVIVI